MSDDADEAERLYWEFDARHKGYSEWKGQPQSERDAFKTIVRRLLREVEDTRRAALEEAAKVCDEFYSRDRALANAETGTVGWGITASFAAAAMQCAKVIRALAEKGKP